MADDQPPKKKSKLKWIILIFLILLLAGGGAGAWYLFFSGKKGGQEGGAGQEAGKTVPAELPPPSGKLTPLPTFLVNLADPLGRRYIKLTLEVELADDASVAALNQQMPKVRDAVILLLSSKSYADIASPENKLLLKSEVAGRLSQILGGPKVVQVYITDMVIQ